MSKKQPQSWEQRHLAGFRQALMKLEECSEMYRKAHCSTGTSLVEVNSTVLREVIRYCEQFTDDMEAMVKINEIVRSMSSGGH